MVSKFGFTVDGNFGTEDGPKSGPIEPTGLAGAQKTPHSCLRGRNGAAELLAQNRNFKANWTMRGGTELF
jgi:hypothetical protein